MVTVEQAVLNARLAGLQTSVNNLVSQFAKGEITSQQMTQRRGILQSEYSSWYETYTESGATSQETQQIRDTAREQLAEETQREGEQIAYNLMLAKKSGREFDVAKEMGRLESKHQSRYKWLQGDIIISDKFNAEYVTTFTENIPDATQEASTVDYPYGFDRFPVPSKGDDPDQMATRSLTMEIPEEDIRKYQIKTESVGYQGIPVEESQPEAFQEDKGITDFLGGGDKYLTDPEAKSKAIREIVPTLTNVGIEDEGEMLQHWDDILTEISVPLTEAKEAQKTVFDKAFEDNDLLGIGLAGAGYLGASFLGGIFKGYTFAINPIAWGQTGSGLYKLSTDPTARAEAIGQIAGDPIGFIGEVAGGAVGSNLFIRNVKSARNIFSGKTQKIIKGTGVEIYADDVTGDNVAKFSVNQKDISTIQADIIKAELGEAPDTLLMISKETDITFDPMKRTHIGRDMARPQAIQFGDDIIQEGLVAGSKGETIRIPKGLKSKLYQNIDELDILVDMERRSGITEWKAQERWGRLSPDDLESPLQQYYRSTGMTKDPAPIMNQGASFLT